MNLEQLEKFFWFIGQLFFKVSWMIFFCLKWKVSSDFKERIVFLWKSPTSHLPHHVTTEMVVMADDPMKRRREKSASHMSDMLGLILILYKVIKWDNF